MESDEYHSSGRLRVKLLESLDGNENGKHEQNKVAGGGGGGGD